MSANVRVKVCGISHPDDARAAVDAGAGLIGVNFVPGSPRLVDLKQAEAICSRVDASEAETACFAAAKDNMTGGWQAGFDIIDGLLDTLD